MMLVTELLHESLHDALAAGRMKWYDGGANVALHIASALQYLEAHNIVHLDVKCVLSSPLHFPPLLIMGAGFRVWGFSLCPCACDISAAGLPGTRHILSSTCGKGALWVAWRVRQAGYCIPGKAFASASAYATRYMTQGRTLQRAVWAASGNVATTCRMDGTFCMHA